MGRETTKMRASVKASLMSILKAAILLAGLVLAPVNAIAEGPKHGLSAFGELKYPADFKHFDWVNPDAPKGGRLSTIGIAARTNFDSFNNFILKGDPAQGLDSLFDTLMTRAYDEPDAVYGLVAQSGEVAPDRNSVTFRLRPEAKFADGSPLTAADVVFSFDILKEKGHPLFKVQLRDVTKADALDAHTVRYTFTGTALRTSASRATSGKSSGMPAASARTRSTGTRRSWRRASSATTRTSAT